MTAENARAAFGFFDEWSDGPTGREHATATDFAAAGSYLRRLDLTLRTQDALHIAIAGRLGAVLATFDRKLAHCSRSLGLPVLPA